MKNEYELVNTKLDTKSWFDHQIIDHQEVHQYTKITHENRKFLQFVVEMHRRFFAPIDFDPNPETRSF